MGPATASRPAFCASRPAAVSAGQEQGGQGALVFSPFRLPFLSERNSKKKHKRTKSHVKGGGNRKEKGVDREKKGRKQEREEKKKGKGEREWASDTSRCSSRIRSWRATAA